MQEIGGYFELELPQGEEYHAFAMRFNCARNALKYFFREKNIKQILLPQYICNSVINAVEDSHIKYSFYILNYNFQPILSGNVDINNPILYVNYFGINTKNIDTLTEQYDNVIVDNCQAFFSKPHGISSIYSPRKFFGVADGGYLYSDLLPDDKLPPDYSAGNYGYLMTRHELSAKSGYCQFLRNEDRLAKSNVRSMSEFTRSILRSIDYSFCRVRRQNNFSILHGVLEDLNELVLNPDDEDVPMVYPFLNRKSYGLREKLIQNNIFIPQYWKEVMDIAPRGSFEYLLAESLVPLPIDQRYGELDMHRIIDVLHEFFNNSNGDS